jgi:hydroxysqualene dehydroxylase
VRSICVIGGGLSGISSAVFLKEKGFDVTLFESSPKLGGRAYSRFDKESNEYLDNGQHILAGWYENTFDFLNIIGKYDKIIAGKSLNIDYFDTSKKHFKMKFPDISSPVNLFLGLMKFKAFSFGDRLAILKLRKLINDDSIYSKFDNVKELLIHLEQSENIIKYFWNPLIYAVFNASLENVSPEIFRNVIKLGFGRSEYSRLLIPKCDLNELFINASEKYFEKNNITVFKNTRIKKIWIENEFVNSIETDDGKKVSFDYYISAVPFFLFNKLFDFEIFNKYFKDSGKLRASAIISVHIFFENDISGELLNNEFELMAGLINTICQWVFKKSNKHISLIISGADFFQPNISELTNQEIFEICVEDLNKCFKDFDKLEISSYRVIKEKRATFVPDKDSNKYRQDSACGIKNLLIAGDWTNTGLPATIESAILSSKKCVDAI